MCFTPGPELAEPVPGSIAEAARRRCGIASEAPREAPAAAHPAASGPTSVAAPVQGPAQES